MSASQTIYGNSGVGTISGFVQVQPLPMQLFGGVSARVVEAYSGYDGKFGIGVFVMGQSGTQSVTVNPFGFQSGTMVVISGGQLSISGVIVKASGEYFNVAASGVGISHYSGALNINISGGTISTTPPAYQSGTLVSVSGGNLALSGLIVKDSGEYFNLASSGIAISHYSGALNVNISGGTISTTPPAYQSGTLVGISGGQLAISGLIVETSGEYFNMAASGVGISHYSGALNVNISGGVITVAPFGLQSGTMVLISGGQLAISGLNVILAGTNISGGVTISGDIRNILSGTVDNFEYPSYTLISYWSGAVGKGLIGIYHGGGSAGQSGTHVALTRLKVGIWASGNINRIDVIVGSGNISGTAGSPVRYSQADSASVVSGWIDGATQISGNVIATVDSIILEANSSGYMHEYIQEYGTNKLKSIRVRSGEEIWVRLVSGIGVGLIALDWIERYP